MYLGARAINLHNKNTILPMPISLSPLVMIYFDRDESIVENQVDIGVEPPMGSVEEPVVELRRS